jgi:spermidine/putrescine transport system permease protein
VVLPPVTAAVPQSLTVLAGTFAPSGTPCGRSQAPRVDDAAQETPGALVRGLAEQPGGRRLLDDLPVGQEAHPAGDVAYYADPVNSVLHDPDLHAAVFTTIRLSVYVTLITVPLGVAFAVGINRWRGPVASSFNFVMILSFVIPELIFGVATFFVFTRLFTNVGLGSLAEVLALVTWNLSWPALIVQARLVTIGRQYEEAAADLGATPWQVTYRVLVRLLTPAIFASAVLVFSGVVDDFVLVDLLSSNASNTPMSVYIYSQQHGGNGGPALNALGTIMLAMTFVAVIIGYIGYR